MTLDDEAMKQVVAKAIVDSLTPERREALIAEAVASLLSKPASSAYGAPNSLAIIYLMQQDQDVE